MDDLKAQASKLDCNLSDKQVALFESYRDTLLSWNERMNLTAITDPREIEMKHFLDSLSVLAHIPPDAKTLVDIGSGAGFPGIPLKIARPELKVTLIEATAKKVGFLRHNIEALGLTGVTAVHGRAEDLGHMPEYRERFDVAVARSVAKLSALAELALPFVRIGGVFIAQKSSASTLENNEIETAANALSTLGSSAPKLLPITLPELPGRELVIIQKIAKTPEAYPRRSGIPVKRPLE